MNRRGAAVLLAGALLAWQLAARAQPSAKLPRIGILTLSVAASMPAFEGFRQGLRDLDYVEGQNIALELRFAQGKPEQLAAMAIELAQMKVDLVVIESAQAARAVRDASKAIPIVMAVVGDPVGAGLVASLARPGGNITGLATLSPELSGKRLELLKVVAPQVKRVAVIWNDSNPAAAVNLAETRTAARSMGIDIQSVEVRNAADLDLALEAVAADRPGALLTLTNGMLLANRTRIVEFTARNRLPAIFPDREFAEAGGLMAYGPSLTANFRRAAAYVDKILKGAKPGDLAIEQPTKFELVVNLKAAKALGITVPRALLLRADEVIQ